MYVIKSGKIAITKAKGNSEIVLAELGPGDMLGEMAFFDNKPRSAGARAVVDSVVIELPFKALTAQFKTFPEWLKAVVRTVNNHLRNANQKIKNLEKTQEEENEYLPPHTVTRLIAILCLVGTRFGEKTEEGVNIPAGTLRRYTIQIFQQPTSKMQKMMELLQGLGYMKVEDLGEGRQKITILNIDLLMKFVDFYNDWIFKSEDKKVTVLDKDMKGFRAIVHFGKKETPNAKGEVRVNLTQMQVDAIKELNSPFTPDDVNGLVEKKMTSEKMSIDGGGIAMSFNLEELSTQLPYWEMIHLFKKIQRD